MLETEEEFLEGIGKCKTDDGIASQLIVAVMTVCGSLGSEINLLNTINFFNSQERDDFVLSYVPKSEKKEIKQKAFYNCLGVVFHCTDKNNIKSRISAKIFPNGSIQIPGCRTIDTVYKSSEIIYNFIKDLSIKCIEKQSINNIIKNQENFCLKDVRIVMINSNFIINKCIMQERLKNLINESRYDGIDETKSWRIATFIPEHYAGINARFYTTNLKTQIKEKILNGKQIPFKLDGQVSVFIFKSGKGTITGAKNTKNLYETYLSITNFIRDNKDHVCY